MEYVPVWIGLGIVVYAASIALSLAITFWIIRAAVLSALAEDRRRLADEARFMARLDLDEARAARRLNADDV